MHGVVQAVGFRESARQQAERSGVFGFVRNRPDGTVEIEAEGAEPAVEALLVWARTGSPSATVSGIDVTEREPLGENRFRVGYGNS